MVRKVETVVIGHVDLELDAIFSHEYFEKSRNKICGEKQRQRSLETEQKREIISDFPISSLGSLLFMLIEFLEFGFIVT